MVVKDLKHWMFEKRDIDGLIVAFLVSGAINHFTSDLSKGFIDPILTAIFPTNEKEEQVLNMNDYIVIKFKLQLVFSGIIKLSINLLIVYIIITRVYTILDIK